MSNKPKHKILDFLFEAMALKRTPRSGYQFLGRGHENVAEHSFGTVLIAFTLGHLARENSQNTVNLEKLLTLALFHDLAEARTGDLNYVNKRYVIPMEEKAFFEAIDQLPFEGELKILYHEWCAKESLEANLAADADQLDMMLELRRLSVHGWNQAEDWLFYAQKRLLTKEGLQLAEELKQADPDHWWFERKDELWVNPQPEGRSLKDDPKVP
jgi:putative hydrolase of HD superfamily